MPNQAASPAGGAPTPAPAEVPAVGAADTHPLTTLDTPPRVRKQVKPKYPRKAFDARLEGTVLVEFLVDAKGRVAKARVIESVPGLDEAALKAIRTWRFDPAIRNGKPVATIVHAPVKFAIY